MLEHLLFAFGAAVLLLVAAGLGYVLGQIHPPSGGAEEEFLDEIFRDGYEQAMAVVEERHQEELADTFCTAFDEGFEQGLEQGLDQVPVSLELGPDETSEAA